jgi:hypothetical protein
MGERLATQIEQFATSEANLRAALDLAASNYDPYRRAPDDVRRLCNQFFFERIYVTKQFEIEAGLAAPLKSILTAKSR